MATEQTAPSVDAKTLAEARRIILAELEAKKKARKETPLPDGVELLTKKQWLAARVEHEKAENSWHRACIGFTKGSSRAAYIESMNKSAANIVKYQREYDAV